MPCPSAVTVFWLPHTEFLVQKAQDKGFIHLLKPVTERQRHQITRDQERSDTMNLCLQRPTPVTELTDFLNLPVSVTVCVFISQSRVMETLERRDSLTSRSERSLASPPTAAQGTVSVRLPSAAEISQLNLLIFIPDKIRSLIIQMSRELSCFN